VNVANAENNAIVAFVGCFPLVVIAHNHVRARDAQRDTDAALSGQRLFVKKYASKTAIAPRDTNVSPSSVSSLLGRVAEKPEKPVPMIPSVSVGRASTTMDCSRKATARALAQVQTHHAQPVRPVSITAEISVRYVPKLARQIILVHGATTSAFPSDYPMPKDNLSHAAMPKIVRVALCRPFAKLI
jgi:hypothetical protein